MTDLASAHVAPVTLPKANEPCWCGSGRKYKRCHKKSEGRVLPGVVTPMRSVPEHIPHPPYAETGEYEPWDEGRVKSPDIIERMRRSGAIAAEVLRLAGEKVAPGVTTEEIDAYVHELFLARDTYPSTVNYHGYPKACCTSVNEVICHGIPDSRPLQDGDICNIDVTGWVGGVHGDTNATFFVGDVDPESQPVSYTHLRLRPSEKGPFASAHPADRGGRAAVRRGRTPSRQRILQIVEIALP